MRIKFITSRQKNNKYELIYNSIIDELVQSIQNRIDKEVYHKLSIFEDFALPKSDNIPK